MPLGQMKKCCCCNLATACIVMSVFYVLGTLSSLFTNESNGKYVAFIMNVIITLLLILGLVLKNWVMFSILAVLCAINVVVSIIMLVIMIIGAVVIGTESLPIVIIGTIIVSIFMAISILCFNVCYSMSKIIQAGGTGWEGKSAQEIEAEKELGASKMEKGVPNEEEHNVQ